MLRAFRNTAAMVATAVLICANTASADSTWTVTVKNTSKVATDVCILLGGTQVGMKMTAVRPDGTASITIPAKKGSYAWKADYGGKLCGSHSVDISGSTAISITCDAAPPASASSQPKPQADASASEGERQDLLHRARKLENEIEQLERQRDYERRNDVNPVSMLAKTAHLDQELASMRGELADVRKRIAILSNR